MASGPSRFNRAAGKAGKQAGMARAAQGADPHWWQCMLEAGKLVATNKPYFYTDDLVRCCMLRHPNANTSEHRAIGPLMIALVRLGYCRRTHDFSESSQRQNHHRPMRVWESLIYRGSPVRKRKYRPKPIDPRQYDLFDNLTWIMADAAD